MSVSGGYHRRTYGNLAVTDNLNLSVDEWSPFTITAPLDDRLPDGGGFPVTMYTLNPNKVGTATDNLRTFSTKNARVYNGVDLNVNARIGATAFLLGGVTHERAVSTTCDQRDNPNGLRFCDAAGPFRTLFKIAGLYELPYAIQVSGSFIARPGASISANYTVTSALAGRPIIGSTAGAAQIAVNLVEPNTMFYDYINQVDFRVARTFRFGKYRLQGLVDIYNLLNAGTVTTLNTTFGAVPATRVWLNPQTIQTSRYVRFGAQLTFLAHEDLARSCVSQRAAVDDGDTVDEDVVDAFRMLVRLEERRLVADRGEIEDHEVGGHSLRGSGRDPRGRMMRAGSEVDDRIACSSVIAPRSSA